MWQERVKIEISLHEHAPGPAAEDAAPADQRKNSKKSAASAAPCLPWAAVLPVVVAVAAALA